MGAAENQGEPIVDVLIAERAPRLRASWAWPLLRPALYRMLGYEAARAMADAIAPMGGYAAMDYASDLLHLDLRVTGAERIPAKGQVCIIVNHPTGLADGVALYDAFKAVRPDICFFANSDAHRINPRLSDIFIPVEWVPEKRTRERTRLTLALANQAFEDERALAIFPAGAISTPDKSHRLLDPPWQTTAVSLARKHDCPVLPVHLDGPWSELFNRFHRFSQAVPFSKELRDITLFQELLNKAGKRFEAVIGPLIAPEALQGDAAQVTEALKAYIERTLPEHPDRPFS
ncbi:MAG TPA: 1-acyl-sn-glycerol-3-phosphate acyltransferase [Caulobacteraceae bacterium]|nr:1-acyl-sn-glycerol-3-phosphate acyltransferase [Caulobacteraceae bacterium]